MDRQKYVVSDSFYSLLVSDDSNPILIVDELCPPRRMFLAKYTIGAVGENARLMFKNELTGYDYEQQITYPTQKAQLHYLQRLLESFAFGSFQTLSNIEIGNSRNQNVTIRVITSNDLVSAIIGLYQFAWLVVEESMMNKLVVLLGMLLVFIAVGVAPMPLETILRNPARTVVIYPNVLVAIPLILLGSLLLLYGVTAEPSGSRRLSQ